jgi:hypothetical protein
MPESAWILGFATTFTNVTGEEIAIGSPTTEGRDNAGYGGLFWGARAPSPVAPSTSPTAAAATN